ncbi:hypothetical protein L6V77_15630 [Myxococcota bacterium]|jgi:hypothetical protein|nr:hypothetical protein [Myxococcota bacterium]
MSVQTTILDLAMVIYDEAVAMFGEGPKADALAAATLVEMLRHSRLVESEVGAASAVPARRRALPVRALRASA